MAHGIIRWLVAVLVVVPLATACGANVVSGTAVSATNGLENMTSTQVRQAAVDALTAAGSVRLAGTATDDLGKRGRVDVRIQGTSCTGTLTVHGADMALTVIGDTQYFKTDAAGWAALGAAEAAPLFADRWVKAPAGTAGPEEKFTIDMVVTGIRQDGIELRPAVTQTTLDGAKVVVVTYQNGGRLYVANTGAAQPLRFTAVGVDDLVFSEHGADFHITAPPDAIDPTTLP